jgi:hypothetical protein
MMRVSTLIDFGAGAVRFVPFEHACASPHVEWQIADLVEEDRRLVSELKRSTWRASA